MYCQITFHESWKDNRSFLKVLTIIRKQWIFTASIILCTFMLHRIYFTTPVLVSFQVLKSSKETATILIKKYLKVNVFRRKLVNTSILFRSLCKCNPWKLKFYLECNFTNLFSEKCVSRNSKQWIEKFHIKNSNYYPISRNKSQITYVPNLVNFFESYY